MRTLQHLKHQAPLARDALGSVLWVPVAQGMQRMLRRGWKECVQHRQGWRNKHEIAALTTLHRRLGLERTDTSLAPPACGHVFVSLRGMTLRHDSTPLRAACGSTAAAGNCVPRRIRQCDSTAGARRGRTSHKQALTRICRQEARDVAHDVHRVRRWYDGP